jgi:hypothetical protein
VTWSYAGRVGGLRRLKAKAGPRIVAKIPKAVSVEVREDNGELLIIWYPDAELARYASWFWPRPPT